jgi:PHD/YefM family antitoxin component YafN of YafNO toxin-antitoxin module
MSNDIQYITDSDGVINSVVIPVEIWDKIKYLDETEYLLHSKNNEKRLMEALNRDNYIPKEVVYERFGI